MKFGKNSLLAAAGFAAALAISTPASADFWWETEMGTLYFDGASGNYGVFRFLNKETGQTLPGMALFLNGVGPQYSSTGVQPGTYDAQWFDYNGDDCEYEAVDPDGKAAGEWGTMSFTVHDDRNYFTAEVYNCADQTPVATFKGTPGK